MNTNQALNFLQQCSLFPTNSWLDANLKTYNTPKDLLNAFVKTNFVETVNTMRLMSWPSEEAIVAEQNSEKRGKARFLDRDVAVQIISAVNVGISKREQGEGSDDSDEDEDDESSEQRLESVYLDPKSIKEQKKYKKESSRVMKLSLTDGFNTLQAIEDARLQ